MPPLLLPNVQASPFVTEGWFRAPYEIETLEMPRGPMQSKSHLGRHQVKSWKKRKCKHLQDRTPLNCVFKSHCNSTLQLIHSTVTLVKLDFLTYKIQAESNGTPKL